MENKETKQGIEIEERDIDKHYRLMKEGIKPEEKELSIKERQSHPEKYNAVPELTGYEHWSG